MTKFAKFPLLLITGLLFLLTGCATPQLPKVFYPAKPAPPRIQFLTSFSSEYDLKQGGFSRMLSEQVGDKGLALMRARDAAFYGDSFYIADIGYAGLVRFNMQTEKASLLEYANPSIVKPMGIAIDKSGIKYVADIGKKQILAIGPDNKPLKEYKQPEGMLPNDIAVDDNYLYVVEVSKNLLHIIDKKSGAVVKTFDKESGLAWPDSVAITPDGNIAVLNMLTFKLIKFSPEGQKLSEFGQLGDTRGTFSRPKGMAIDHDGRIYVLDAAFENLQLFNPQGKLYMALAKGGVEPQDLMLPSSVSISYEAAPFLQRFAAPGFKIEYVIIVSNQYGPSKINLYGFGHMAGVDYSKYPE
ncbi:hypothetical protein [Geopsychrobacter electrodiphilus]|uniref:hypothetical protein n=1 Tax=Geopsychrobacter electrodiphilus TaxID=225196 RepID=UPI0003629FB1|nr:hypothetical protein [Geopsychrobacter electrodiphilus]